MNRYILFISILICSVSGFCADFKAAVPFVDNYTEKDFKVSCNNQDIIQDKRGILYFANDYGILEFDGYHWDIIQIASNRSNIQSLAIDENNRIYVGAHGDFGYLQYTTSNGLNFKSLLAKIPKEYQTFGDVSNTFCIDNEVLFQSKDAIFVYKNDSIQVISLKSEIDGAFKVLDKIIIQTNGELCQKTSTGLQNISSNKIPENDIIQFVLPYKKNTLLVATRQNGLFTLTNGTFIPFKTSPTIDFASEKILSGKLAKNNEITIGTATNGIYFMDQNGTINCHLNKVNGLQNNFIKKLFFDKDNNLWSANKIGIDMIETASPFSRLMTEDEESQGIYDATIFNNKLYVATHNGVMVADTKSFDNVISKTPKFTKIKSLTDINWNLSIINGTLLIAHEKGFTAIRNDQVLETIKTNGAWKTEPIPGHPNLYLAGTYNGFIILKQTNGKFELYKSVDGFTETCRVFTFDENGYIWMAHGYKGIYKLKLKPNLDQYSSIDFYDTTKGLPLNYYNSVFNLKGQIHFSTQLGLYRYDSSKDTIVKENKLLTQTSATNQYKVIQEDAQGNIWFVSDETSGIIRWHSDGSQSFEKNPLLKLNNFFIPGFEFFTFLDNGSALIGTKDGLVYYNCSKKNGNIEPFNILLREVKSIGTDKTTVFTDWYTSLYDTLKNKKYDLPYSQNDLQFSYSSTCYENINNISYQYYLEGFDKDWSDWSKDHYKQYTNLPEGKYIFRVRARNTYNIISDEGVFRFSIKPPWYRTVAAYFFDLICIITLLWLMNRTRTRKLQLEKTRFMKEQMQERYIERAAFKEEKLNDELLTKNQELSGLAMKVIYKNEKLSELKEKVTSISEIAPESIARKLDSILGFIDSELNDDNWDDFAVRFDSAHNNFIARLKTEYPDLTHGDLKTCAYLRMNLSTKEIARLLNMTVRGVETARLRIRKRMGLDATQNLNDFIITY